MMTRFHFALAATLLAAPACGGGDSAHPVDEVAAALAEFADAVCGCAPESERAACRAVFEMEPESVIACQRRVYDQYAGDIDPTLQCQREAVRQAAECVRTASPSCDTGMIQVCTTELNEVECPELPGAVDAAFAACDPE